MRKATLLLISLLLCATNLTFAGTTGKIAGTVVDAETGDELPGVNITIEGTTMGAATNLEGYYVILNVPPGTYTMKASMIGYADRLVSQVRVNIDLTTSINFTLRSEVLEGEAVTIVAERQIVKADVAWSEANLNIKEIESLPVVAVQNVIGMEAGIRGMTIRGGGSSETAFMVNGFTMRDERDNSPYTAIPFTSIEELKIQTGGFSAEFGNIRSGVINAVTKEGSKNLYSFSLLSRYSPASPKHFGHSPMDPNSFWIRPYVDDEVCWTGTQAWPEHIQKQYPQFEGWNAISEKTLLDEDPTNDLSPYAAQKVFLWEHRRELDIQKPDYDLDLSFGGPVPFISEKLGDLRFFTAFRRTQDMYLVPLADDAYRDYNMLIKLTSDISQNMKLKLEGMLGQETGVNSSRSGGPGLFSSTWEIANELSRGPKYIDGRMYGTDYWCPSTVTRTSIGAKLTHTISPSTFYEASLQRFASGYDTNPGERRDNTKKYQFGNSYFVDEAPFGWEPFPSTGIVGLRMGVGMGNSRDTSSVATYTAKFDFTSQLDRYNNVKAGFEFSLTDNYTRYALIDSSLVGSNQWSHWHTYPVRAALYLLDKIEFRAMNASLGVRLDYSHGGGEWYDYSNPYDDAFSAQNYQGIDTLLAKSPTKRILTLNPRLSISFPITVNSKLFFNYGHFRQMPTPENLYLIRRYSETKALSRLADPNNPLPRTIAYELGYEHDVLDQFHIRLAGYYKDAADQSRLVSYVNLKNTVSYSVTEPNSYQDTRGFELTIRKNRGEWVQGFINYTYEVITSGYFGFGTYYENRSQQRQYEAETRSHYQEKPVPRPYARLNVDFFTPIDFGPEYFGFRPLDGWRLNVLVNWRSGVWDTWTGGGTIPGILYNVQWRDYWNVDLRLSKNFRFGRTNVQFFVDVTNATNYRYMTASQGFVDGEDYNNYMKSLHLPAEIGDELGYGNIPGNDRPGDYRDYDVPFEPYDPDDPDEAKKQRILDTKAYIDMPNQQFFTFLDPRNFLFGLKVSFDIGK